ncbi:DUF4129 domain-containing protein [Halothermothrix orenii]|nr:DUF4129 domain-containing protein [Halothermothrix orenii]
MDYSYKPGEFDIKFNIFYPLLGGVLHYILFVFLLEVIRAYNSEVGVGILIYLIGLIYIIEGVFSGFIHFKINLPRFFILLELAVPWVLYYLTTGVEDILLYILISGGLLVLWASTRGTAALFFGFNFDYRAIKSYDNWESDWRVEDHMVVDYPVYWKNIFKRILYLNFALGGIWLFVRQVRLSSVILTSLFTIGELLLLTMVYFEKARFDWLLEEFKFDKNLNSGWQRAIIITVVCLLAVSFLLPVDYSPLTISRISDWVLTNSNNPDLDIEFFQQEKQQQTDNNILNDIEPGEEEPSVLYLIITFIHFIPVIFFIIVLIGFILSLVVSEIERAGMIPTFFLNFYLFIKHFVGNLVERLFKFARGRLTRSRFPGHRLEGHRSRKTELEQMNELISIEDFSFSGRVKDNIIKIFTLIQGYFSKLGLGREPAETPFEYSDKIIEEKPGFGGVVDKITRLYVEAVYSNHSLPKTLLNTVKNLWKEFKKMI